MVFYEVKDHASTSRAGESLGTRPLPNFTSSKVTHQHRARGDEAIQPALLRALKVSPLHYFVHKSEPAPGLQYSVGAADISIEDFAVGSTVVILTVLFPYPDGNSRLNFKRLYLFSDVEVQRGSRSIRVRLNQSY